MDAYNGLNPGQINPTNRPPAFTDPPAPWEQPQAHTAWTPPSTRGDIFWDDSQRPQAYPNVQTRSHIPPESTSSFENPEYDDLIRSINIPDLSDFNRSSQQAGPSHLSHPRPVPAPEFADRGEGSSRTNRPRAQRTYGTGGMSHEVAPTRNAARARPQYDEPILGRRVPTPAHRTQTPHPTLPHTPPRRPNEPNGQILPESQRGHPRPSSRTSVLSYVEVRNNARPPSRNTDAMVIDDDLWNNFVNPPQQNRPIPGGQGPLYLTGSGSHGPPLLTGPGGHGPPHPPVQQPPAEYGAPPPPLGPQQQYEPRLYQGEEPEDEDENDEAEPNDDYNWMPAEVTPAPDDDWRDIQGDTFYYKYKGQSPQQASRWLSSRRRGLLFSFAGHEARDNDDDAWPRQLRLEEALKQVFRIPNPEIYLPDTENGAIPVPGEGPVYCLLQNITAVQQTDLLRQKWYVRRDLAVRFVTLSLGPSTWMGSFEKRQAFGTMKNDQILPFFRAGLRRQPLLGLTMEMIERDKGMGAKSKWGDTSTYIAFEHVVSSINIRGVPRQTSGGTSSPLIQLYCDSPTAHPRDWVIWREAVRNQHYSTENGAKAILIEKVVQCRLCHSINHSVGLCDLPTVPGWNGPTPDQLQNDQNSDRRYRNGENGAQRGRGGGRGGHGGGASRGRGGSNGRGINGRGRGRGNGRYANPRPRVDEAMHAALLREADEGWSHQ
ncbi:uncharacterized protein C8Q71DRAFT_859553 [Rhodofomes roseus]|uniref:Uncharacterized protein n=1 Tax=Rhodofomes roseus TaxID=34475 RepID=A0ABQ8KAP1_9APHY|nr:uncharacterized protein C8Q71DRAFT_859553 [Rhodofomes roseus]KAH9834577.1 hypothetical protein C8Q71DRAFT_859553 [Rhodofomes roseus]